MSKRCLKMESLPHEVVECILERLPVKSLLRFKSVSKQWRLTIESPFFKERQLTHRHKSRDPDVLMLSTYPGETTDPDIGFIRTLVLGSPSPSPSPVEIPAPWEQNQGDCYKVSGSSCDGLVCFYAPLRPAFVVNPATRWYRTLPLCQLQLLMIELGIYSYYKLRHPASKLGFGKDKITGTYKPVWLYNSLEIGLENATTCEVFDFSTNAWRYVTSAAPCRVDGFTDPVYVDGSLHWFTECEETKVVSFDLHREAFQVLCKAPFANAQVNEMAMCNLDSRLCVSVMKSSNQVIWSFNSGNKTWDNMCSIDVDAICLSFDIPPLAIALLPLALLDGKKKKKNKLLFRDYVSHRALMTYDLETKSYATAFSAKSIGHPVCYFPSLFSVS